MFHSANQNAITARSFRAHAAHQTGKNTQMKFVKKLNIGEYNWEKFVYQLFSLVAERRH